MRMPVTPKDQPTRPPNDRGQGRKALPPEDRTVLKSVRLKPIQWSMYDELGGAEWLRSAVEAAHKRLKKHQGE